MNGLLSNNKLDSYKLDGSSGGTFDTTKIKGMDRALTHWMYNEPGSTVPSLAIDSQDRIAWVNTSNTPRLWGKNGLNISASGGSAYTVACVGFDSADIPYAVNTNQILKFVAAGSMSSSTVIATPTSVSMACIIDDGIYIGFNTTAAFTKYNLTGGVVWSVNPSGQASSSFYDIQKGIDGNIYIAAYALNIGGIKIYKINPATGATITSTPTGLNSTAGFWFCLDSNLDLYWSYATDNNVRKVTAASNYDLNTPVWSIAQGTSYGTLLSNGHEMFIFSVVGASTIGYGKFDSTGASIYKVTVGTGSPPADTSRQGISGGAGAHLKIAFRNNAIVFADQTQVSTNPSTSTLTRLIDKITV